MTIASTTLEQTLWCGLVALRNGVVSADQLAEALADWCKRPTVVLDQVLGERLGLTDSERQNLRFLLEDSMLGGAGPVRVSDSVLAPPVAVPSSEHATIQAQSVDALGRAIAPGEESAGDPADFLLWDPESAAPDPLRDHPRFRILRPYARGGIGEISIALDTELKREVALKAIQPRYGNDPASRSRFLLEAEITGRLEHPGIVPVYGMGNDPTGRPFYAMRFVRGESLKDAIESFHTEDALGTRTEGERRVALRQLLGRFVDVCQVAAYAHSRGIIHRDIKPANVLLGPYGETLLVDWGLAKVVGRPEPITAGVSASCVPSLPQDAHSEETLRPAGIGASSESIAGFAIGTPQYMSPEQSRGALEELGPATDIYSLGATLYVLLTGRTPFVETDVVEMLECVSRGEFEAPRGANRRVPRPLEAVILKAMATDPAHRYPSARDLAGEIERWLADEPVLAFPEPPGLRLVRWVSQHRLSVTAGAVAGLMALLALLVLSLFQREANLDMQRANGVLARANGALTRVSQRATERFELAQVAFDRFQTRISQEPQLQQPRFHAFRDLLIGDAIAYYRQLHAAMKDDPDPIAQESLALAFENLATLCTRTGGFERAVDMLGHAVEIREAMLAVRESLSELTLRIVRDLAELARLQIRVGRSAEAAGSLQTATVRLDRALVLDPGDPELLSERVSVAEQYAALNTGAP